MGSNTLKGTQSEVAEPGSDGGCPNLVLRKDFSYNYIVSYSFKKCLLQRDFGRLLRDVF